MNFTNEHSIIQDWIDSLSGIRKNRIILHPIPIGRKIRQVRNAFDECLDQLHYAGKCQRVGRCMRLLIINNGNWVGGIVLGSTFANIGVRDKALGLKKYIKGYKNRKLRSPWARENRAYWNRLQKIVNHARTFILPEFQKRGLGIRSHKVLLTQGKKLWEDYYNEKISAFDTLCDAKDSHLFLKNGWTHVGVTAGYESDPQSELVSIDYENCSSEIKNNVALKKGKRNWEVWIRIIDKSVLTN